MALSSVGLIDIGMGAGLTANFHVQYETSLPNQANVLANANALLPVLEQEFAVTTGWFNTPGGKFGAGNRQVVNLNLAFDSGANNSGYGNAINMDGQDSNSNAADAAERVKMIFMNEWVEILMSLSGGKWHAGDSSGEGLSQYCGIVRFQAGHYSYYNSWVDQWLNQRPRQDWVTTTEGSDKNPVSFGCALAFIYYLNTQLHFSINQILAAGAANLATVFRTLTGDPGDPFPFFAGLLERVYPSSATAGIPGPVTDNPFPLAQLSFWVDKNTFGKDEVQDVINTGAGTWQKAFWLVVEGFSMNSFNALGVTLPAPTGPFANLAGISISPNPDIDFENAANPSAPQRIRVPYDITFTNASLAADFPAAGSQAYELDASLTINGTKVPGSDASAQFELVAGADPYFTNIDPTQNNVFYLSQDLRVFTATPGLNSNPVQGGPAFPTDSVAGAFNYVQQVLAWLNTNYSDPTGTDPFTTILPGQGGALLGDSSVTPSTLGLGTFSNYNFAVARVRLRGTAGSAGAAKNVRVFFRLWITQTADTDYQTASTYPSTPDAAGQPGSPLVGANHYTLPFFASGNLSTNADYAAGGANIRDITINTGDSTWAYYGCFLNLYDSSNIVDGLPVQAWLTGTHHCIVAQIAFDGVPIAAGASPEASDQLAQRNLQITLSDNPGAAATHRIPQTFDLRPSAAVLPAGGPFAYPDELMIDWGAIPRGSVASIYWPAVLASDVLALAAGLYGSHTLSAADAHTIQCTVTGSVTYVPIPAGAGENFAGLFTVDLPTTVVTGQEFNVVVRRIASHQIPRIVFGSPPSTKELLPGGAGPPKSEAIQAMPPPEPGSWRYVVGTFQVRIPVSTGETMLRPEENTLAIMKWRLQSMAPSNRWHPVLQRYIEYASARVDGLGGDSDGIKPSLTGAGAKAGPHCKTLGRAAVILLGALVASLGALTGTALTIVPPTLAVVFLVIALIWIFKCHPRQCRRLRAFIAGAASGAVVLAILALAGITAPQLVPVLCTVILLLAIVLVIGGSKKCF
jgi:hypothetical protein